MSGVLLLKGCERRFRPSHPQARYCRLACREAARRWRRRQASRRYRGSANGRQRRQEQSRRYRQRRLRPPATVAKPADGLPAGEGQRPAGPEENFCQRMCARPGCYELFWVASETSGRRFCSLACRLALRRVLDREERYRQRRRRWRRAQRTSRRIPPDTS
jgi:hypothetical protein